MSQASTNISGEMMQAFKNKGFVIALLIFALGAVGLNATMLRVGLYFKKERVELRHVLDTIPRELGPWLQVNKDVPFPEEIEHALGTRDYINRRYLDTRLITGFDRAKWDAKDEKSREEMINIIGQKTPRAIVSLHIAYYTGLVDTVAHVPERCYVAGGLDPVNPQVATLHPFDASLGRAQNLKLKFTNYVDRARPGPAQNVAYFFQVNGRYEYDSIGGVRVALQNIREKFAYYAKIELATRLGDDTTASQKAMEDFLHYAMPSIETALPDWTAVTGKPAVLNSEQ